MKMTGKTEKRIDTDCREGFSGESTILSVCLGAPKTIESGQS